MKKILIDSHVFLWWHEDSDRLSRRHKKLIDDPESLIFISIASLYELYLKSGLGKLDIPDTIEEDLIKHDMEILRISFKHLNEFRQLPRHHKDPLDRMIISQAIADNIPVISYDDWFKAYDIELL